MKSLIVLCLVSLSISALAGEAVFYRNLAGSDEFAKLEDGMNGYLLQSISRSQVQARCPGCFNLDVTFKGYRSTDPAKHYRAHLDCATYDSCKVSLSNLDQPKP